MAQHRMGSDPGPNEGSEGTGDGAETVAAERASALGPGARSDVIGPHSTSAQAAQAGSANEGQAAVTMQGAANAPGGEPKMARVARRVAHHLRELVEPQAEAAQRDMSADMAALKGPVAELAGAALLGLAAAELALVSLFVERRRARFVVGSLLILGGAAALGARAWMTRPRRLHIAERAARIADDVSEAASAL